MKREAKKFAWMLGANAALILIVCAIWQARITVPDPKPAAGVTKPATGPLSKLKIEPAPWAIPASPYLKGLNTSSDLAELKGQWTVLNIWASWCAPCLGELASLQKLANLRKGQGLAVLAISVDQNDIRDFVASHDVPAIAHNWDHAHRLMDVLKLEALPTTYILDPGGRAVAMLQGDADWAAPDALAFIDSLMHPDAPGDDL